MSEVTLPGGKKQPAKGSLLEKNTCLKAGGQKNTCLKIGDKKKNLSKGRWSDTTCLIEGCHTHLKLSDNTCIKIKFSDTFSFY